MEAFFTGAVVFVVIVGVEFDFAEKFENAQAFLLPKHFCQSGIHGFFFGLETTDFHGLFKKFLVDVKSGGNKAPRFRCVRFYTMIWDETIIGSVA
ncbi:MAG: hypothetical protein FWD53_01340 [Phycisphaerales bacterium]|nr:hypothetical protein [Phycisphaerales bacterium]